MDRLKSDGRGKIENYVLGNKKASSTDLPPLAFLLLLLIAVCFGVASLCLSLLRAKLLGLTNPVAHNAAPLWLSSIVQKFQGGCVLLKEPL